VLIYDVFSYLFLFDISVFIESIFSMIDEE